MATLNYWWVTRPKRKLNSIPEVLGVFSNVALSAQWSGSRNIHIQFEDELEKAGLKRIGERRDHSGSGGRTYQAWLSSLGLIFIQNNTGIPFLTLAGNAIMQGNSPIEIMKMQILKYQFPSPFGIKTKVSDKFHIHPFIFLLRLLSDKRIAYLTEEEIAKIVITNAFDESEKCYENVVESIKRFRSYGDDSLPRDFIQEHAPSSGKVNYAHPYSHLLDTANTIANWLEYTQLVQRNGAKSISISSGKVDEVNYLINKRWDFINRPEDHEYFQRKYGLDPYHQKDTRNLINTSTVTSEIIETQRIRQAFIALSMCKPVSRINSEIIKEIADRTGTNKNLVEKTIYKEYPRGAIGGFLSNYYEMAFKGRDECKEFEIATTSIFSEVFGFEAKHLGQTGSKSAPDILLISDNQKYQAIIDNKAYSEYSISGDHHNRMVHNYLEHITGYSNCSYPIGFFSYIAGGFTKNIDKQIQKEVNESGICGSAINVSNMIRLVENNQKNHLTHQSIKDLFSINRQIVLSDFE